jgi:hypothetical protein
MELAFIYSPDKDGQSAFAATESGDMDKTRPSAMAAHDNGMPVF